MAAKKKQPPKGPQPDPHAVDWRGPETVDAGVLDTFPYEYAGKEIEIVTETDEFTSVCPWSGLPDFGLLQITYVPKKACLELRSLKYYLMSYRDVGIYYEHAVSKILEDLVGAVKPKRMTIEGVFNVRGGLQTTVTARWPRPKR